jgi:hypothetical protein
MAVTMTAEELLVGLPQWNPERILMRTLVPAATLITHVEPADSTCTPGLRTTPQSGAATLGSEKVVTDVALAVISEVRNIEDARVATISERRAKAPK